MKYYTTVGDREKEVELSADGVRIDGETLDAELAAVPDSPVRHLRVGTRVWRLTASRDDGVWEIGIGGRKIPVRVEDERRRRIREMTGGGPAAHGPTEVRAPMPGKVVRVEVRPGQEVEPDAPLVVMEAMKMENELTAERPGTVRDVKVEEGDTVNQSDLLVRIE